jgi:hypothetical protein
LASRQKKGDLPKVPKPIFAENKDAGRLDPGHKYDHFNHHHDLARSILAGLIKMGPPFGPVMIGWIGKPMFLFLVFEWGRSFM